jgi:acyl carrier protein
MDHMQARIADIKSRFGQLNGVFYTAALDAEQSRLPIGEASREEINSRFQTTLQPLFALEEVLRDKDLDFCVLMSSLSSVLGGPGLLSASAQGVFMDAFAARQNQTQSVPWTSIDWDLWDDNANKVSDLAMTPAEAMKALGRVLAHNSFSPVVVSTGDLHSRIARWINLEPASDKQEVKSISSTYARPNLANPFVAPRNEMETTIVEIWQSLLGINGIGVHDNLFDLGGDSLLAIQIVSRIRETLHTELSLRSIFETPTVAGVVESIEQQQHDVDAQMESIDQVIDLVEQLSEEELELLIAAHQ